LGEIIVLSPKSKGKSIFTTLAYRKILNESLSFEKIQLGEKISVILTTCGKVVLLNKQYEMQAFCLNLIVFDIFMVNEIAYFLC